MVALSPTWPTQVAVVDVTPRDGLQDADHFVTSEQKLAFINFLLDAGIRSIEATSFMHPKWIPQLADADIVSCYEQETLHALLARTRAYLPSGGRLLIHDLALTASRSGPHNAALFLFGQLAASAQTQVYTVDELGGAVQEAGFMQVAIQPFLPDLTFLVSGRKP
jgi:hypothetical protein